MTTQERLARLHNRLTCYEIAAIKGDRRILICYSQSRSRSGLLAAMRKRGDAIITVLEISDDDQAIWLNPAANGCAIGNGWTIRATGRTERDAIGGELPYVGDLYASMNQEIPA
jgi:hypothetical protein